MAILTCSTNQAHALLPACSLVSTAISLFNSYLDDVAYIANVGDSRAFMSVDGGNYNVELSRDHKPNDDLE